MCEEVREKGAEKIFENVLRKEVKSIGNYEAAAGKREQARAGEKKIGKKEK